MMKEAEVRDMQKWERLEQEEGNETWAVDPDRPRFKSRLYHIFLWQPSVSNLPSLGFSVRVYEMGVILALTSSGILGV